jgi:hypothetical protein
MAREQTLQAPVTYFFQVALTQRAQAQRVELDEPRRVLLVVGALVVLDTSIDGSDDRVVADRTSLHEAAPVCAHAERTPLSHRHAALLLALTAFP